jgi:protein-S-isoprenylcysteine O-methyltransferase Ste14
MKQYIKTHWQRLLDIYIFLNFLGWTAWQTYSAINEHRFDFIEASFFIQNLVLTSLFLIRSPRKAIDRNVFHQVIALVAFFSGALFMGNAQTSNPILKDYSMAIILLSNILGIFTLFNLGKSFGILISYRKLQSKGLYSVVRHPMYVTDILLRIGFLVSHFNLYTVIIFVVSTACYVYRAILEERFLCKEAGYSEYMQKVKYRFIPYIF